MTIFAQLVAIALMIGYEAHPHLHKILEYRISPRFLRPARGVIVAGILGSAGTVHLCCSEGYAWCYQGGFENPPIDAQSNSTRLLNNKPLSTYITSNYDNAPNPEPHAFLKELAVLQAHVGALHKPSEVTGYPSHDTDTITENPQQKTKDIVPERNTMALLDLRLVLVLLVTYLVSKLWYWLTTLPIIRFTLWSSSEIYSDHCTRNCNTKIRSEQDSRVKRVNFSFAESHCFQADSTVPDLLYHDTGDELAHNQVPFHSNPMLFLAD
jgi:hypothetical protein